MTDFLYLTHPQVLVDPAVPVPRWGLSEVGRARTRAFAACADLSPYRRIVSSTEEKAMETAALLADALGLPVEVREGMEENDRSATGYLPEAQFQQMADGFFARPHESVAGWERAQDAQARIVAAISRALAEGRDHQRLPVLFAGHGGVGTLLLCHLAGYPISRIHDQPPVGGGCWFRAGAGQPPDRWRTMEEGAGSAGAREKGGAHAGATDERTAPAGAREQGASLACAPEEGA
ncbi:histidine phosphatase family protein [Xanthobacter autotrophicus]|uniref:histidine phosphatase family protein n=1 Tax=Xanthobacter autotrophicus TaxID=280 RepID=UPI0024A63A9B|nr:histidine phosphatase family protein [Xanthobacter autotrophicus]MDI4658499.1 phosphoglycerate mutase family protein [Xanthobacter autotrophicus]